MTGGESPPRAGPGPVPAPAPARTRTGGEPSPRAGPGPVPAPAGEPGTPGGLREGDALEVLWHVGDGDGDGAGAVQWWKAALGERLAVDAQGRQVWQLDYEPLGTFPAEARRAVFLPGRELQDLDELEPLRWKLPGEPAPELPEEERVLTVSQLVNADRQRAGVTAAAGPADEGEAAALRELKKRPIQQQQAYAQQYRQLADTFKGQLQELIAAKGTDHVISEKDIQGIVKRMRSG